MLDVGDRLAIHELLGLYGHLIDERRWNELDQVFTADAVYDASDFGHQVTTSLADLIAHWTSDLSMHPLAHHATNIVVIEDADGTVERSLNPARLRPRFAGLRRGSLRSAVPTERR